MSRPALLLVGIVVCAAVLSHLLTAREAAAAEFGAGARVAVATDALNVRGGPGLSEPVVHVVTSDMLGTVGDGPIAADGYTWYTVAFDAGSSGWLAGEYLRLADDGPSDGFPLGTRVFVNTDRLNVRATAGLGAEVVNVLPQGYEALVGAGPVAADGYGWYRVDAMGGELGWVAGEYLALAELVAPGEAVVVNTDWLNLRSAPGLGSAVVDVLPYGTRATVTGLPANPTDDGYLWVGIETDDGAQGWVAGMYLVRA
jgi:N-acetylmuramoyl-L-alanine amidase